jgi:NTP pyrophosphatase (non-canonical NTP hydrolase)
MKIPFEDDYLDSDILEQWMMPQDRAYVQMLKGRTLNAIAKEIHDNALAHGWWDEPREFGTVLMLCTSELSEALEADRSGEPMVWDNNGKPDGVAVEMADCIIRILDWAEHMGVDMETIILAKHEYNKTRPYKHGKKY